MMSNKSAYEPTLTLRTPHTVGRREEIERLHNFIFARGEIHCVYYHAAGGLGKTRLLEEVKYMVQEAGPGFYCTDIIDLYHTDTHSSSDVERAIVDGLDPDHKYFANYRRERTQFEVLRERGSDPGVLERRREKLSQIFIDDWRLLAIDARKLVILLDTVELLQYESSVVEDRAGSETVDTRIRTWLLQKLPHLANVLIIFAGRPKARSPEETIDHQARLIQDMRAAFGDSLMVVELKPFTLAETRDFVKVLTRDQQVIPADMLPVVHKLTGGRPIFLHLVVDLLQVLALEPSRVLRLFDQYRRLVDAPEEDEPLHQARRQIEVEILRALINEWGELGEYLRYLALLPKGVDVEILREALGLPINAAKQLLDNLAPLSFIKRYLPPPGAERLHRERTFLHDEMYRLLTNPEVIPGLYVHERTVAQAVISSYYNPYIAHLGVEIAQSAPEERIALRERLQKLQVERLYYLLVRDPGEGYVEYKRLSDQANRRRWVGFSMRLLDEFLRFYNIPDRRKLFEAVNISHNRVIRESAELWVERFYWWGQRERAAEFAQRILDQPDTFAIRPGEHVAILGNIYALWTFTRAVLRGYEAEVVKESVGMLAQLPELANCNSAQALARARLLTAIGYQFRLQGQLAQAAANYVEANAAFRKLGAHPDEWAVLLNNLAFVYAKQGRLNLAAPLAHQALQINEALGSEYSTGLTLSALATIERMRGNYSQAVEYGEEALALFRELEDAHGTALAYLSIAQARRRMAKHSLEIGRKLEEARQKLEAARLTLDRALDVAREAGLGSDLLALLAEQGRVYRELGQITTRLEGFERGIGYYHQSVQSLEQALTLPGWAQVDRADTLQDLAEVLYELGNQSGAEKYLIEIKQLIGSDVTVSADDRPPGAEQAPEHFAPLGKVEMLRGRIAMSQEKLEEGVQHYLLAYAYFIRFSPEAVEKDILIEYLYNHLRPLSVEQQQTLINSACAWGQQQKIPGVEVDLFAQTLKDLLGV